MPQIQMLAYNLVWIKRCAEPPVTIKLMVHLSTERLSLWNYDYDDKYDGNILESFQFPAANFDVLGTTQKSEVYKCRSKQHLENEPEYSTKNKSRLDDSLFTKLRLA